MRKIYQAGLALLLITAVASISARQKPSRNNSLKIKKSNMEIILIDRFIVPAASKAEFLERANFNRKFIATQPGFLGDNFYEDDEGTELRIVTMATWASQEAIDNARRAVTEYYQQQGFDMPAFMKKLHIQMERGIYKKMEQ